MYQLLQSSLAYLPSSITDWYSAPTQEDFLQPGHKTELPQVTRNLRFFNHACLHNRRWRKWTPMTHHWVPSVYLSENMMIPDEGKIYSINEGNLLPLPRC
ncbi:hypothetical protein O9992_06985 [Vibrio lentus]|nr:hypothetical protein [Vibrio lentus]